jgi:hypothetical protein
MRLHAVVCVMAVAVVAACAPTKVGLDEGISAAPGQSYVLIATNAIGESLETHDFVFQRVDMATATFGRERAYVRITNQQLSGAGDEFAKPATMAPTKFRFAGSKVPAGDYALVSQHVIVNLGISNTVFDNCFAEGAPVYRFREGAVNIVQLGYSSNAAAAISRALAAVEIANPAAMQAQVNEVLAGYPNMAAPRAIGTILGTATFTGGRSCGARGSSFSFTRAPGVSVDW